MPSIAVLGPGAIGSAIVAALDRSGHPPIVCGRRRFDRLVVSGAVDLDIEVRYVDDPDRIAEPVDIVFVAVKAHQTPGAAAWFDALVDDDSTVVVAQNGVEHEATVRPFVGAAAVVPVVVKLPAHVDEPGHLDLRWTGVLDLPDTAEAGTVAALFDCPFLSVTCRDDFAVRSWTKLLANAVTGGMGTLTRQPLPLGDDERAAELARGLLHEIITVARAEGVELPDDAADRIIERNAAVSSVHQSSIIADRLAGRPTEWNARNEVVVRVAGRHGIDVPLNRALSTLIRLGEPPS